jgi:hypothetical protein
MEAVEKQIEKKIARARVHSIFFTEDFREMGTPVAVKVALHRLVNRKVIGRLARGIYAKPDYSKLLKKEVMPGPEDVAKAIAKRDHARIMPTGNYALNALGLSTQVPVKIIYLTDATPRKIKIGNTEILFKRTAAKNLQYKSELCMLAVQALKAIGQDNRTREDEKKIIEHLKNVDYPDLKHDIKLAPQWIAEIMAKAIPV